MIHTGQNKRWHGAVEESPHRRSRTLRFYAPAIRWAPFDWSTADLPEVDSLIIALHQAKNAIAEHGPQLARLLENIQDEAGLRFIGLVEGCESVQNEHESCVVCVPAVGGFSDVAQTIDQSVTIHTVVVGKREIHRKVVVKGAVVCPPCSIESNEVVALICKPERGRFEDSAAMKSGAESVLHQSPIQFRIQRVPHSHGCRLARAVDLRGPSEPHHAVASQRRCHLRRHLSRTLSQLRFANGAARSLARCHIGAIQTAV